MKMYKSNLIFLSSVFLGLFIVLNSFTYSDKSYDKVVAHYGQETVDFWKENNPRLIQYYTFFVDSAWYTAPATQKETTNLQHINAPLKAGKIDRDKFNILTKQLKRKFDAPTYVIVQGSSEMIIIRSEKEINATFNKYYKPEEE